MRLFGAANTGGRSRGQSLVELSLLLPILVVLMLGALDLGRAFHFYTAVANATRAGGVYALSAAGLVCDLDATPEECLDYRLTMITDSVRYEIEAQNIGLTVDDITVDIPSGIVSGEMATVTVDYSFGLINPLAQVLWGDGDGEIQMSYSSIIRLT